MARMSKEWLRENRRQRPRFTIPGAVELVVNLAQSSQDEWLNKHEIVAWLSFEREPQRDFAHCVFLKAEDVDFVIDKLLSVATIEQKERSFARLAESLSDNQISDSLAASRKS